MSQNSVTVTFRPIVSEDFGLLKQWQNEPHVAEVWGNSDYVESYEEYVFRTSQDSVKQYLILNEEALPIGYIQYYWASKVGDGWWDGYDDSVVGIDFYIGNPTFLMKGYGSSTIKNFVELLFTDKKISKIIADPSPSNKRIISLLSSNGFQRRDSLIQTPDGPALLMSLIRS